MARPKKEGMDYFSHDTDAVNDEKVEALRSLYGNDGYAFYFILLERIYRTKNAELDISKPVLRAALVAKLMMEESMFEEILQASFDLELFDRDSFQNDGTITSRGVKKRHRQVDNMRNNWRKQKENDGISDVFSEENPEKRGERKEKKSKEKKSKYSDEIADVISYLNNRSGKSFKPETKETIKLLSGRFSAGKTVDDCKNVIDLKVTEWRNDQQMKKYIRPATLFDESNFENYLNEAVIPGESSTKTLTTDQVQSLVNDFESKGGDPEAFEEIRVSFDNDREFTKYIREEWTPE